MPHTNSEHTYPRWAYWLTGVLLFGFFALILLAQIGPPARGCLKDYAAPYCTSGIYNPQPNVPASRDTERQAIAQYGFDPVTNDPPDLTPLQQLLSALH